MMLKSLLPKEAKLNITIDDVRLKSNLTTDKTFRFSKKSFFYVILGFTQSHSGELGDVEGFIELIPGTYKGDKPINLTGIDKIHLKADCIQGSIVNGTREQNLFINVPQELQKIFQLIRYFPPHKSHSWTKHKCMKTCKNNSALP